MHAHVHTLGIITSNSIKKEKQTSTVWCGELHRGPVYMIKCEVTQVGWAERVCIRVCVCARARAYVCVSVRACLCSLLLGDSGGGVCVYWD